MNVLHIHTHWTQTHTHTHTHIGGGLHGAGRGEDAHLHSRFLPLAHVLALVGAPGILYLYFRFLLPI
jgi:hypothetical protein